MEKITDFRLRAFYPTYNYYKFLIKHKREFPVHKIGEGYRNPVVEYWQNNHPEPEEIELSFEDAIFLLSIDKSQSYKYLEILLKAKNKDKKAIESLKIQKAEFYLQKIKCH